MLKRINWRAVMIAFTWILSLSALIVLMSFIEIKKTESTCTDVKVVLPGNQFFIERAEIDEILKEKNGLLIGRRINNINIQFLEDKLKANPFIEYAKVYMDVDGIIHADVRQRVPVLRVLNLVGQDFYIDQNGLKIPLSDHFTARVLVANGAILENFNGKVDTLKTEIAKGLFQAASFIEADSLWTEQIVQIYVNDNKDLELVPRVGNQKIILGDAENINIKLRNLFLFYKKALPEYGWDTYSTINLKYDGQIVCTKKDSIIKNNTVAPVIIKDTVSINTQIQDSTININ